MKKRILSFLLSIITILSAIAPTAFAAYAADFETQMRNAGYPESYIPALIALHEQHPNWSFKPLMTNENFSTAVDNERKPHNQQLIQKWSGNDGKGYYCTCENDYKNGNYVPREGSDWISASKTAVEYYMDPRNFLNEQYIFQFLSNEYNSSHTQSGVEAILKGTWMYDSIITYKDAGGKTVTYKDSNGNTVKYSKAIMNAAKDSGLSAYYIASKIKQEVGGANPTAGGARGTGNSDGNYKGIYNYYNINATTGYSAGLKWAAATPSKKWLSYGGCNMRKEPSKNSDILIYLEDGTELTYIDTTATQSDGYKWVHVSATVKGKTYTGYIREDLVVKPYNRPWTNPYLSIYNGAQWIADNYKTQNTGYLQKFNVNPASSNRHEHEYMANVQGAASEGNSVYKAYKNNGMLDENLTFLIPVYMNMPVGNLKIPEGISLSNGTAGVKVSWKSVSGAEQYTVFRKTASTGWTPLGNTLHTNYTDKTAKSNVKYYYSVCCTSADGKSYTSGYDSTGKSITFIAAPVISSISGNNSGTEIKWNKPAGAVKFKVYRKTGSSGWKALGTTTSTSFIDKTAAKGTKYGYTVRCISKDGKSFTSGYYTDKSFKLVAAPKITSISHNVDSISIKWDNASGSKNFKVYRKTPSTGWKAIKNVSATSYTDTSVSSGTTYTYTVRCLTDDGKVLTSGYDTAGKSITYVTAPVISSISGNNSGTEIKWNKPAGAVKFKVYRKTGSSGWKALGTTTSTSFIDKTAAKGTKYGYTVRCISKDGKSFTSGYYTDKSFKLVAAPKITSISHNVDSISIKWDNASGSKNFKVYRKTPSTGWKAIKNVSATSYTDTSVSSGTTYTYTVRCLTDDGKVLTSGYDTAGKSIKYVTPPVINSVKAENEGIEIVWNKVNGAEKYKIYRKTENSGWTSIGLTSYTYFTDKQITKGTNYIYTVRCADKNGTYISDYDHVGKSAVALSSPSLKNDMVQVAEKEVGKNKGGKKFWSWAGYSSRVPWCNLFVAWCADQLGYYPSKVPLYQKPKDTAKWYQKKGLFKNTSYIPKAGDLIIFDNTWGDGSPTHIGIVEKYQDGRVYCIEGNNGDDVKRKNYLRNDREIYGYATPDYGHN